MSGLLAMTLAVPALAELKIGVVDYNRLMKDSPQAKAAQETLQREFSTKQKEMQSQQAALKAKEDKLQKDGATMSADDRAKAEKDLKDGARDYQQRLSNYQEDLNTRQNEELSRLQGALVEEVRKYAQAQKYDLVMAEGVIYSGASLDITEAVLAALQARGVSAAPAAPAKSTTPAR
ncbi:MAG: OmpH family outer membrane protein [Steroidobacteraceae bacterium]